MNRFLVTGSPRFNNYYLLSKYLDQYIPRGSIICTCGCKTGVDAMAEAYALRNHHFLEAYPVKYKDMDSIVRRNSQITSYCAGSVMFFEKMKGTVAMLDKKMTADNTPHVLVAIDEKDNYDYHWDCVNQELLEMLAPITVSNDTVDGLADTTLAILNSIPIIGKMVSLGTSIYTPSNQTNISIGIARWLVFNEIDHLKAKVTYEERKAGKKPPVSVVAEVWSSLSHPYPVATTCGLPIAKDFVGVVHDGDRYFLEIKPNDFFITNIWRTSEQVETSEEDPVDSWYETKDESGTRLFFRNVSFENSPFSAGMWYVDLATLIEK